MIWCGGDPFWRSESNRISINRIGFALSDQSYDDDDGDDDDDDNDDDKKS